MPDDPIAKLINAGRQLLNEANFSSAKMDVWSIQGKRVLANIFDKEIADRFDHMLNASAVFRQGESLFDVYSPKIRNAIDYLESLQSIEMPELSPTEETNVVNKPGGAAPYVREEIISAFEKKQEEGKFNFKKLVRLLNQLNHNYALGNEYSAAMLIRGILDHVPPLLGQRNFEQVASNYPWGRTDKEYMRQLLDSKPISDDALHRQISSTEDVIEISHLPSSVNMNRLLQECLSSKSTPSSGPKPLPKVEKSKTDIVVKEPYIRWAQWSGLTRSFRALITIDNFNNSRPNFIEKVVLKATNANGDPWTAETFKIGSLPLNERCKIEPHDKKDESVLVSQQSDPGAQPGIPMPDIDRDNVKLEFILADGTTIVVACGVRENS